MLGSAFGLQELQSVAEAVVDVEAPMAGEEVVRSDIDTGVGQSRPDGAEVLRQDARVRLLGWYERLLDAEMNLRALTTPVVRAGPGHRRDPSAETGPGRGASPQPGG